MRALLMLFLLTRSILACQICMPYPKESLLDKLNAAESLVLARENPGKAFHLKAIEVLRGEGEGMDVYLPSASRRMLAVYPDRAIVCGLFEGEWQNLGVLKPHQREVFERLITNTWGEDKAQRAQYFAQYLNSSDENLSKLAHLEVARAPYAQIRELEHEIEKEAILEFIGELRMAEWHALYILFFAQMADENDATTIRERFLTLAEYHLTLQLAAWTLAFLETEGAVEQVSTLYFNDASRSDEEVREVVGALGTYGAIEERAVVSAAFSKVLEKRPEMLKEVLPWLIEWQAYEAANAVAASLSAETDFALASQARAYLKQASARPLEPKTAGTTHSFVYWLAGALLLCALIMPFLKASFSPRGS